MARQTHPLAQFVAPQFNDPNQAISWLAQAGNSLPISQWNALHDQAIRAQAMGVQMPQYSAADPNVKAAVQMQNQNVTAARTVQEIGQANASFPLMQAQRQQDLYNSGLTAQKTQQDTYNAGLAGQRSAQEIGQSTQSFPLSQFGQLGAQESDIAKQYGTDPGSIMTTLKRRNLVRDSDTQLLREANPGEAPHASDALSYYVDPKYEPNATGLATKVPGYFKLITDQDAGMMQDMANRRIALNLSMMQQGGQPQQSPMGQQPTPQRTNTGWGIFGNEGNAGDYHTNYLQDEANAAGQTPQGYLASIVARQNAAPQMQGMAQSQGAMPSQYQPYSTPPSMHSEFADLAARRAAGQQQTDDLTTQQDPQFLASLDGGQSATQGPNDTAGYTKAARNAFFPFLGRQILNAGAAANNMIGGALNVPIGLVNAGAGMLGSDQNVLQPNRMATPDDLATSQFWGQPFQMPSWLGGGASQPSAPATPYSYGGGYRR